jgi:hypothetical protein
VKERHREKGSERKTEKKEMKERKERKGKEE